MAKQEFKAESKRLLDMMINSIYTHKEIFLRELISNASDACDKRSYLALTDDSVGMSRQDFAISLSVDKVARTITVADNGIGMSQEDLENNLGVIAASGSYKFKQEVGADTKDTDVIGQFGVGFYSAFMIADHITVSSRKQGADNGYSWESDGAEGYSIEVCDKETVGTTITIHVKDDTEDEHYSDFLEDYKLQQLVRKYSDYIRFPIQMDVTKQERVDSDKEGAEPVYIPVTATETLNSMVPIWQRPKADVTDEEYNAFYQEKFHDYTAPARTLHVGVEGNITYKAMLFVPAQPAMDFYTTEFKKGLQLYSSGVMIMDSCGDLVGDHFRFVRGIVDSPDLSLNISRELLQHDRQLRVIANNLEKKIKSDLMKFMTDDRDTYNEFWKHFGRQLKYGITAEYGAKKDLLQDLLLFYSSTEEKFVSLGEYVSRMKEDQTSIYYATGESVGRIAKLPQIEGLQDDGVEILYLTEEVDEFVMQILREYNEKPFASALDANRGANGDDTQDDSAHQSTLDFVKEALGDAIASAKVSHTLKSHPVCLTAGEGLSFEMEKYFATMQPDSQIKAQRILELNTSHPSFAALETAISADPEKAKQYAQLLYAQSLLIAGLPLEDPSAYTDLVCGLMV
ncbi:molecular chaperone HtpG [Bengtsoniella intestinalis]|uniref:molecular chaperone HtpG n=1 Tax=Bengtsoniella intestinalis TaxID=3073143 RepID=UPI00391F1508